MQRRHIPARDIDTLGDISFDTALQAALRPSPDYDTAKWLFVPNTYTEYRYILGTRGARPLICLGVNPSTAAPEHLDPTLQSVQRIALNNGFDSFIMLNVCAQRATSPSDMALEPSARLHAENVRAFAYALSLSDAPSVWAAWGNIIEQRAYLSGFVRDLFEASAARGAAWYRCGAISKRGHPHHPLYLRADEPLVPFDMARYAADLAQRRV